MSTQQTSDQGQTTGQQAKKKRLIDKICPNKILEIVPESQTYHDMFAFERKLDSNITRKTLDIQEALRRPMRIKKALRIFISNLFYTHQDTGAPSWELRIEGRLTEDSRSLKRKFSSFFRSLVIELDHQIYGPDNHLIEWVRTAGFTETDGFQVRRPGDLPVKCTILFKLEHQPHQFKLDKRLAKLLGRQIDTRPAIIIALWQYIKNKSLQDPNDREYINNDKYLKQIFECKRMKFSEIPAKLNCLLSPPDPIIIHHSIVRGIGETQRSIYEIDVEVEDLNGNNSIGGSNSAVGLATAGSSNSISNSNSSNPTGGISSGTSSGTGHINSSSGSTNTNNNSIKEMREPISTFTMSNASVQELQQLDEKVCDTLEAIKLTRNTFDLLTSFANDPHQFTNRWLATQSSDLKLATDQPGDSEEERRAEYYYQPWLQEAVCRYFYRKIQERRGDLEIDLMR